MLKHPPLGKGLGSRFWSGLEKRSKLYRWVFHAGCLCSPCDRLTLFGVRRLFMRDKPRAAHHLKHYLHGGGQNLFINSTLLLREDPGIRSAVFHTLRNQLQSECTQGTIVVPQWLYSNLNWRCALGGIRWHWMKEHQHINTWFTGQYTWHPNEKRITQPFHKAAENLKRHGAQEYSFWGSIVRIPLQKLWQEDPKQLTRQNNDKLLL